MSYLFHLVDDSFFDSKTFYTLVLSSATRFFIFFDGDLRQGVSGHLDKSMDAFDEFGLNLIAVSHCTGNEPAAICYNRFKERFAFANAGWSMVF